MHVAPAIDRGDCDSISQNANSATLSNPLNAGTGDEHESLPEISGAFAAISVLADVRFET